MLRKLAAGIGLGAVAALIVLTIGATFDFATRLELATYDQRMQYAADPASVNKNTFVLRTPSNQVVAGTVTLDSTGTIATFTPTSPLGSTRTFTSSVIGGAGGVKDVAGNPLASTKTWTFTTR